mmetsp:Transcript_1643/g.1794  ORF Transcript_1643/g.1794 Transcript_1643/m.1794 type:complete len:191 (-) Transcript_1643:466-1038(-)|eukprot:CAMPEP_0198264136 /NCGR_PEP_ID=MMETSP1447-20131203/14906_1 /TAXON_ID=420782 /ORGANISM="Chaetoceros dichaeta, Strain CCMP1751" /LENGTH=190 /DNA_ID=CAMNT_0043952987 /DNA_START=200 /DNA_END=772 /DNA_ORIENTATION=-
MSDDDDERTRPNILITGTPGVGKTATAILLAERLNLQYLNIGSIIEQHQFHSGYDEQLQTHVLDEDKLLDHLEVEFEKAKEGSATDSEYNGLVTDYHSCDLFPERWFDLVLVLRADTHVLYDRLSKRGYCEAKREQNMQCEIMQVLLEEAKDSYAVEIVQEMKSNTIVDMEETVVRVKAWCTQWIEDHTS